MRDMSHAVTEQPFRVAGRGLVDLNDRVGFSFDGRDYYGYRGDTLASALLANGVRLVGRSFKYHRPRGVVAAGPEEPNALLTIGEGAEQVPNTRATMQEVYSGLSARSQNAWPSLRFDALAANDALSAFLGAGFYYKTFMWPPRAWERLYEPFIRRAAGLGRLSGLAAPDRAEKASAHADLLVIGAGPAGLMAALIAGRAGLDVILADEHARPGGRCLAESFRIDDMSAADWAAATVAELDAMSNVRVMRRTTVTGVYDGGTYGALERTGLHLPPGGDLPAETFWRIVAPRSILAAGAIERMVAFPGNDRPGVMLAGAVRTYLHRFGVVPGRRVAVFGGGAEARRTAQDLLAAGVEVVALIDPDAAAARMPDCRIVAGGLPIATSGRRSLSSIEVAGPRGTERLRCDLLAVAGGWNPALHLTCHLGAKPRWDSGLHTFVPASDAVPGMRVVGAAEGAMSTGAALRDGAAAGAEAAEAAGLARPDAKVPTTDDDGKADGPAIWHVPGRGGRAFLDLQNDVTAKDVARAAAEGFDAAEHMKRYTTQGMATDQGKLSNVTAMAVLARATGRPMEAVGTTTFRPPYTPVSIAAMGAGAHGPGFAPRRLTTSHHAAVARGAPMVEAGLWFRPSYFPRPGEATWQASCVREAAMVRRAVGVTDVSTLGKIAVQGPDAGAFLDFVYANRMSSLKVGRVRYGIMLREDGHVLDDGTCARLGEESFLVTTTTAAAGLVMRHLEFAHQVLRPDLAVALASVTEHWAQFAVTGPRARTLLEEVAETRLGEDWPFMSCGELALPDVPARLFRISFSGELGFELAVPARFGASVFEDLVARAEAHGGGVYGMEALNVLRIEKGFPTHAEMDGRVTAGDLGLGRMVSDAKDCIGRAMSRRPGLSAPDRPALIGLRPVDGLSTLLPGATLFAEGAARSPESVEGRITSAGHSPEVGAPIALGLLQNGRERHGERVQMFDCMRGVETLCDVGSPVFVDPEGERMRG